MVAVRDEMFLVRAPLPTSPSPRKRGSPPSPPAMTRAERAPDWRAERAPDWRRRGRLIGRRRGQLAHPYSFHQRGIRFSSAGRGRRSGISFGCHGPRRPPAACPAAHSPTHGDRRRGGRGLWLCHGERRQRHGHRARGAERRFHRRHHHFARHLRPAGAGGAADARAVPAQCRGAVAGLSRGLPAGHPGRQLAAAQSRQHRARSASRATTSCTASPSPSWSPSCSR